MYKYIYVCYIYKEKCPTLKIEVMYIFVLNCVGTESMAHGVFQYLAYAYRLRWQSQRLADSVFMLY